MLFKLKKKMAALKVSFEKISRQKQKKQQKKPHTHT